MNCPKCGGTNGFVYNLIMKANRSGNWGMDDDEEVEIERIWDVRTVTCMDCGKRVDWDIAHGKAVEHRVQPTVLTHCPEGHGLLLFGFCDICKTQYSHSG